MHCHLCGRPVTLIYGQLPGFQKGYCFDVYECYNCDLQFASPLRSSDKLYNLIYQQAEKIAGYDRYVEYAANIAIAADPLGYLAGSEEAYHFVARALEAIMCDSSKRLLELGSGLGYLTYAINRKGYNIRGIDIADQSVALATARFGQFFQNISAEELALTGQKFDGIILTEVIEHVENIYQLFDALDRLLESSGFILLTTPNKSFFPNTFIWNTELPPVHLWWFSESTMRLIARRYDYSIEFFDFTDWNTSNRAKGQCWHNRALHRTVEPMLSEDGRSLAPSALLRPDWVSVLKRNRMIRRAGRALMDVSRALIRPWRRNSAAVLHWDVSRSKTMGVILRKGVE